MNAGLASNSMPGQARGGKPIHDAPATWSGAWRPSGAASTEPAATPIMGAHRRSVAPPFSETTLMTMIVPSAVAAAPMAVAPGGVSARRPKMTGSTVAGASMFTVPTMVGVSSRLNTASRMEIASGTTDDTATRLASKEGPPSASALMQTGMNATGGPIASTCPAPIRPSLPACSAVQIPLTATTQNAAQDTYSSVPPAALTTIVGIRTMLARPSATSCRPNPRARAAGGRSMGS